MATTLLLGRHQDGRHRLTYVSQMGLAPCLHVDAGSGLRYVQITLMNKLLCVQT